MHRPVSIFLSKQLSMSLLIPMIEKIPAEPSLHIMVYAMLKNIVKSYSTLAEAAKLNLITVIEYGGKCAFPGIAQRGRKGQNANVFMEISEKQFNCFNYQGYGKLDFQRTVKLWRK